MPRYARLLSFSSRVRRRKKPELKKTNSERPLFRPHPTGFTKNDYYYDQNGSPMRSTIDESQPLTVGFLSFVDSKADPLNELKNIPVSPFDKIAYQFQMLCAMFPDFPRVMMKTLLAREYGDANAVYSELISRGWINVEEHVEFLTTEKDIFNLQHFWGEMRQEYIYELSSSPPGSYFVAFIEPGRFVICCELAVSFVAEEKKFICMAGFSTASGKTVGLSTEAKKKAQQLLFGGLSDDEEAEAHTFGFATAGGAKIQVSDEAKRKAHSFMKQTTEQTEQPKLPEKPPQFTVPHDLGGFSTAGGKKVNISESSKQRASAMMTDNLAEDFTSFSPTNESFGFATAGGKKVQLSEASRTKAASFMNEIDGFSTAGGKQLQISPQAKQNATNLMNDLPAQSSEFTMGGFATAGGKKVELSEAAKKRAASILDNLDDIKDSPIEPYNGQPKSYFEATTKTQHFSKPEAPIPSTGFTSAKGTSLDISASAKAKASSFMKDFLSEFGENEGLSSLLPQPSFATAKQLPVPREIPSHQEHHKATANLLKTPNSLPKLSLKRSRPPSLTGGEPIIKRHSTSPSNTIKSTPRSFRKPQKPKFKVPRKLVAEPKSAPPITTKISSSQKTPTSPLTPLRARPISKIIKDSIFDLDTTPDGRVPLKDLKTPQQLSIHELIQHGIPEKIIFLTYENAHEFSFNNFAITSEELKPFENSPDGIGYKEMKTAMITLTNNPKIITDDWIINHYKLILSKLAAMERTYPDNFANTYMLPDRVFLQLKYRYEREYNCGVLSPIRKMLEKDTIASRKIILCICKIIKMGSDPFIELEEGESFQPAEILLTDGWYCIPTIVDKELTKRLVRQQIRVGQKIVICGGRMNSQDATTPLENETIKFIIGINCTKRCHWAAKLGFRKNFIFSRSISTAKEGGGALPAIDVVVLRKYPICWIERLENFSIFRNERDEHIASQKFQTQLHQRLESKRAEIMRNITARAKTRNTRGTKVFSKLEINSLGDGDQLLHASEQVRDENVFYQMLSLSQRNLLRFAKEERMREDQQSISAQLQSFRDSDPSLTRQSKPIAKILIQDCPAFTDVSQEKIAKASLTIWTVNPDSLNELKEGQRIRILFPDVSKYQMTDSNAPVQLSCKNLQCFPLEQTNSISQFYVPRRFKVFEELNYLLSLDEFDGVGLLLYKGEPKEHFGVGNKPFMQQTLFFVDYSGVMVVIHLRNASFPVPSNSGQKNLVYSIKNIIYDRKDFRYDMQACGANEYSVFTTHDNSQSFLQESEKLSAWINSNLNTVEQLREKAKSIHTGAWNPNFVSDELDEHELQFLKNEENKATVDNQPANPTY